MTLFCSPPVTPLGVLPSGKASLDPAIFWHRVDHCRVGAPGLPGTPPTEPDLRTTHPAPRDVGVPGSLIDDAPTVGGGFPAPPFRSAEWVHISTVAVAIFPSVSSGSPTTACARSYSQSSVSWAGARTFGGPALCFLHKRLSRSNPWLSNQ